jgi:hypothetical protein
MSASNNRNIDGSSEPWGGGCSRFWGKKLVLNFWFNDVYTFWKEMIILVYDNTGIKA